MAGDKSVDCVADVKALLGEGPVWVERDAALYWVDIEGRLHLPAVAATAR